MCLRSGIHEECGVFGVMAPNPCNVAGISYYGLYALQHRGQESCGIVVNDDGVFISHKDLGLVSEVFPPDVLSRFPKATMAVAHTRYGTTGKTSRSNCQPLEVNHQKGRMALAHNGNLSNAAVLRSKLELSGGIFHTTSDTETIAYVITRERLQSPSIEDALSRAMNILDGAYSLVLMSSQKLICARDPYGFRPLCYGKTADGAYVVASESCAIKAVGAEVIRDVEPGEILVFSKNGVVSRREHCGEKEKKLCSALMEILLENGMVFRYMQRLAKHIPVPEDITSKVIIEYKGKRSSRPELFIRLLPEEEEFHMEDMRRVYQGIFIRQMVLFDGEVLEYRIYDEEDGKRVCVKMGKIDRAALGEDDSRFSSLNEMGRCLAENDRDGLKEKMKEYLIKTGALEELFQTV